MQSTTDIDPNEEESGSSQRKSFRSRCRGFIGPFMRKKPALPARKECDGQNRHSGFSEDYCKGCSQPSLDCFRRNNAHLNESDRERLNIILEMYLGECEHVNDLHTAIKSFMEPIRLLCILDAAESYRIFYTIENLVPIFERLVCAFSEAVHANRNFSAFVRIFTDWVGTRDDIHDHVASTSNSTGPEIANAQESLGSVTLVSAMDTVIDYISHLYEARECLEAIRNHKREFADFLGRCHTTTFSKRLDLWHFLDSPRTRLLRYPLLINRLIKLTPMTDPDVESLFIIRKTLSRIAQELDSRAGETMCLFHLRRIQLSASLLHSEIIIRQKLLILSGMLKTKHGPVKAFVFSEVMLLTVTCSQTVRASKSIAVAPSTNSNSNASLIDPFTAKCTISRANRHWRALTRRISSRNEPQPSSSSSSKQCMPPGPQTESQPTVVSPRRGNSVPLNVLPEVAPHLDRYQVYKQPILLRDCVLENLSDGWIRFPSLRRTLLLDNTGNNMFRIYQNSATRMRSQRWETVRRYTDPMMSEASKHRESILSSCRFRARTVHGTHAIESKNSTQNKHIILLQAPSAEEKTLWISTLSPLVGKVFSQDR